MSINRQVEVQSLLNSVLLESKTDDNETVQVLEFTRDYGVPLTNEQAKGLLLLQQMELNDLANYFINIRSRMTPLKWLLKMMETMTLANRIKGTAKLDNILKQNANPALSLSMKSNGMGGKAG